MAPLLKNIIPCLFLPLLLCSWGCDKQKVDGHENHTEQASQFYYTCSMHPSVRSDKPGKCPICGMPLIKKEVNRDHKNMLHLSDRQQLLVNLKVDTAKVKNLGTYKALLGTVIRDEQQLDIISATVKGRLEKLYLRNPGEIVKKGQLLYSIYSEALLAAQSDYLQAIQQQQTYKNQKEILDELIKSAKDKLLLWKLNEKQINEIVKQGKASPYLNFYSNTSGIVSGIKVEEGSYVDEGSILFEISDLTSVWVEAQAYSEDLNLIKGNNTVKVEFEIFPGEEFPAELAYITPQLEKDQKINLVRYKIKNTGSRIRPGMMAYVNIVRETKEALVIPKSALLLEKMKIVWIETDEGMFERRMVTVGAENKKEVEILSGVEAGEMVVTSGGYLLNSEYVLQQGGVQKHNH